MRWHCHSELLLPCLTISTVHLGALWCWTVLGVTQSLARDAPKHSGALQGCMSVESRMQDAQPLGAASASVCATRLTELAQPAILKDFASWLADCFTFRSLNKQEMKRTSNKATLLYCSAGKLSVSLWGMEVPAPVSSWMWAAPPQPSSPFYLWLWKGFLFSQHGEPCSSAAWKPGHHLIQNISRKKREWQRVNERLTASIAPVDRDGMGGEQFSSYWQKKDSKKKQ